jgi:hypothetical protein
MKITESLSSLLEKICSIVKYTKRNTKISDALRKEQDDTRI